VGCDQVADVAPDPTRADRVAVPRADFTLALDPPGARVGPRGVEIQVVADDDAALADLTRVTSLASLTIEGREVGVVGAGYHFDPIALGLADGARVRVEGRLGEQRSDGLVLEVDLRGPSVADARPSETLVGTLLEVQVALTDEAGPDLAVTQVEVSAGTQPLIVGKDYARTDEGDAVTLRFLEPVASGLVEVRVRAADRLGNVAPTETLRWVVDRLAPSLVVVAPSEGALVAEAMRLEITPHAEIAALAYRVSDAAGHEVRGPPEGGVVFASEVDLRGLDEGPVTLEVSALDVVGNAATVTRHALLDRTAPTLVAFDPPRTSWVGAAVTVTVTASDAGSGLDRVEALDDTGAMIATAAFEGETARMVLRSLPAVLVVVDRTGHRTSTRPEWRQDLVAPTVTFAPAPTSTGGGTPRVSLDRIGIALTDAGCGIDLAATRASLEVGHDGRSVPVHVDVEGVAGGLVLGLEEVRSGIWTVSIVARDRCGNERPVEGHYLVDADAPEVHLDPVASYLREAPRVVVEAYDLDGLDGVRARLVGGEPGAWVELRRDGAREGKVWSGSVPIDGIEDGVVTVEVEARDRAGNRGRASAESVVDRTPPEVSATLGDGDGWVTPECVLGIFGSDRFELATLEVWDVDGVPVANRALAGTSATAWVPISVATDGVAVRLAVRASDRAGNAATTEAMAAVDHLPPRAIAAFEGMVVTDPGAFPTVAWTIEDSESGPDLVRSVLSARHDGAEVPEGALERTVRGDGIGVLPREPSGGRWRFELAPRDRVGRVGPPSQVAVDVDLEAPQVALVGVAADGWSSGTSAIVEADTSDDTGVVEARFAVSDPKGLTLRTTLAAEADGADGANQHWRHVFDLAALGDGEVALAVEVVDRAGRLAETRGLLKVDNLPPSLAVAPPSGLQGARFPLHVDARDEGAGLASISVFAGPPPGPFEPPSARRVGTMAASGAASFAGSVEVALASSGRTFLTVVALDRVGRMTVVGVEVEVDAVAPTLTFEPASGAVLVAPGGEPRLFLRLSDDRSGVDLAASAASLRITSEGAVVDPVRARVSTGDEGIGITFARDLQLAVRVEVRAADLAGNVGPSRFGFFTVDTRGPRLINTTPTNGGTGVAALGTWAATFDEAIHPTSRVVVVGRDGVVDGTTVVSGTGLVYTPRFPYPPSDTLTVSLEVRDEAGNPAEIAPRTFRTASFGFVDVAPQLGLSTYRGGTSEPGENHGPGGLFADLDEDGFPDLVLAVPAGKGLSVYRNVPSTTTAAGRDLTPVALAGPVTRGGTGVVGGDVDNDGDLDLFVTYWNMPDVLYANRLVETGSLSFEDITASTVAPATPGQTQAGVAYGVDGTSSLLLTMTAAFADVDRDGALDLYVGTHNGHWNSPQVGALPGQRNTLFRNLGNGTFSDITRQAGVFGWQANADGVTQTDYQRHSSTNAVIFADLDNDRWPDLIVTNKTRHPSNRDMIYRNLGRDEAGVWRGFEALNWDLVPAWGGSNPLSMGVDAADVDNDGDVDLYITDWAPFGTVPGPNELWLNRFVETGEIGFELAPHCTGSYSWGARFEDFDNDGHLDLHVASNIGEYDFLYMANRGTAAAPFWAEMAAAAGVRQRQNSRGSMTADLDRDGWMDLFVVNLDDAPRLYWNRWRGFEAGTRHWLAVKLVGDPSTPGPYRSTRDAMGAKVTVVADIDGDGVPEALTRWVTSGSSSATSTSSLELEFGLGVAEVVDVWVAWPSGRDSSHLGVGVDHRLVLSEGAGD
jgi:hypothetical protein